MKTLIYCTLISAFMAINSLNAQEVASQNETAPIVKNPPVTAETMFSNNGVHFQTIINKKLASAPKFGLFALGDILGKWDNSKTDNYMIQGKLTYRVVKGLDAIGGFHMASGIGARPSLGAMYTYSNPNLIVLFNPNYNIDDVGNVEGFLMGEYKPKISEIWRFYSRVQGLYVHTTDGSLHSRSYARLRLGLSYKEFSFGVSTNFDYYGPGKINENSYGVFITTALF